MTTTTTLVPRAYAYAQSILAGRTSRRVATETHAARHDDGRIAIAYRGTDVTSFMPDGSITLDNGGWPTVTTKRRMDTYLRPLGMRIHGYVLRHGSLPKSAATNPWRVTYGPGWNGATVADFQSIGESGIYVATPWNGYFDVSPMTGAPGWGSNYGDAPRLVATISADAIDRAPWTLDTIRACVTSTGSHWFDAETMAFWRTELFARDVFQTATGAVFVTGDRMHDDETRYSVRSFDAATYDIDTVSGFGEYETRDSARHAAQWHARRSYAYTIDVCEDCYMAHAGVVDGPEPDPVPLSLIKETSEVTSGCLECEPCGHPDCANGPVCGCGWGDPGHGFSWSRCEGCGSSLGGNRYSLVIWPISH